MAITITAADVRQKLVNVGFTSFERAALAEVFEDVITQANDASQFSQVSTTADTLVAADNGKTVFFDSATGFTVTLPAPSAGLKFRFVVTTAPTSGNHNVRTHAIATKLIGGINELEVDTGDDGPYSSANDVLGFVANVAAVGDFVDVVSNGTHWYVGGQTRLDGGAAFSNSA